MTQTIAGTFIGKSRRLLREDYLPHIERSVVELGEDDIWWRPHETSNSIGNLLLHLRGNVTQWIIGGVGRRDYVRERQREFDEREHRPAAELLASLRQTLAEADEVIGALSGSDLLEPRDIQGYHVTVLEAVYHVVEHFATHTGQIVVIAKMRTGKDLKLWVPPAPGRAM